MKPYYELAYALASKSLCFFVGTGFSKHLSDGTAPDWLSLLKSCCKDLSNGSQLVTELFPAKKLIMPLEECASIIDLQMQKEGKSLYNSIATKLADISINTENVEALSAFALKHLSLKFITTNYDLLIEEHILKNKHTSFSPGFPVNRQRVHNEVFHVHGVIDYPEKMVVTADDYYRFINAPSYFSKKLDTLLEENTTVIMGYSLGDMNFKSILNSHHYSGSHEINRQHLFFLSRNIIPQHIKDYYDCSYGLRVIDQTEIGAFILSVDNKFDRIINDVADSKKTLKEVLSGDMEYTNDYIKKSESFFSILATISTTGTRITDSGVINLLQNTITRKHQFSGETGAWQQYVHLADWLVQLGCVMDLEGTELERPYLDAVVTSFKSMSRDREYGKSWDAYQTWKLGWGYLTYKNRSRVRRHISELGLSGDFDIFIQI